MLAKIFLIQKKIFCPQKLKKPPSEVAQKNSNSFFSLTASTAQMAQTAKFMFQNMAYRPTVYRTWVLPTNSSESKRDTKYLCKLMARIPIKQNKRCVTGAIIARKIMFHINMGR